MYHISDQFNPLTYYPEYFRLEMSSKKILARVYSFSIPILLNHY